MSNLKEMIAQRDELNKLIAEQQLIKRSDAILHAKALISENELTQQDLFGTTDRAKRTKTIGLSKAMYRDHLSDKTWNGHGRVPKWIKDSGKDKAEFLIKTGEDN